MADPGSRTPHSVFWLVLRVLLGGLLFYAGFSKLASAWQFARAIANFRLLPPILNQIAAVVLPWYEAVAGLMLVLGLWTRASSLLSTCLFAAFGIAVSAALARGLDIECGCFGTGSGAHVGALTLILDLMGLAASIAIAIRREPAVH